MQRISGLADAQVLDWEARLEAQMVESLQAVMDKIAARISRILVGAVTTGPTGDDDPPAQTGDLTIPPPEPEPASIPPAPAGAPPGQPYISPDDLASITPLWQEQVAGQLLPLAAQVFIDAAGKVRGEMLDALPGPTSVPLLGSLAAEQHLARAKNTYDQVGDHLWATARAQLSEGFEAGESIDQLAARLRQSAGLTARTGVLVARTSVIEASNAGSIAMARASGLQMQKEWIATPDLRTRPTHLAADGQRVDLAAKFTVGGHLADFPVDPDLPPSERFSCRCAIGYVMPDSAVDRMRENLVRQQEQEALPGTEGPLTQIFPKESGPGVDLPARGEQAPSYVRPSLAAAKTPRQLRRVWQDEVEAITGFPFLVDAMPRGISMVTAREYAEGTLQMFAQFPGAKLDRIHWFDDAASTSYAQVRRGGHALEFNMRYASETGRPKFLAARRRDVAGYENGGVTSWGVRNDLSGQGVVYHEFTHILDIENAREAIHGSVVPLLIREAQREGVTDIADLIQRRISSYAASARGSYQELVAEAGTDVMVNGAAASQLSREIFGLLRTEYRRRGFEIRAAPLDELAAEAERLGEAFPKIAAPKPIARMTVAELRAEAKARGVTVPPGARKADLVRLVEADVEKRADPAAAIRLAEARPDLAAVKATQAPRAILDLTRPRRSLTEFEDSGLDRYGGDGGYNINRSLREGGGDLAKLSDRHRAAVEGVDAVMADSLVPEEITLYRLQGRISRPFGDTAKVDDLTGLEWMDDGYLSTSVERWRRPSAISGEPKPPDYSAISMRIKVPPGTPAISDAKYLDFDEVLVGRGQRLRVIADHGMVDGVRQIDVEIIATPSRAAQRAAARAQAATISTQRANAALIARIDELVQAKASKAVIRQELDPALREAEQLYAGADEKLADALRTAVDSGDAVKIRAALTRQSKASKVTPIGKAGAKAKFDPATMEGVGGTAIPDGANVVIVRRGARIEGIETPERAIVRLDLPPRAEFDVKKAKPFQPTPLVKRARIVDAPAGKIAVLDTPTGTYRMKGRYVEVLDDQGRVSYAADYDLWIDENVQVPGDATGWRKVAPVDAYRYTAATPRTYVTLVDGRIEKEAVANKGDWIIRQKNGQVQVLSDAEFQLRYTSRPTSTATTVAKGDFAGLTRTSEAMGGNPGGIFEAGDGSRWYVKQAAGIEQARSEALALDLYRAAGLDAPELVIGEGAEGLGQRQIATRFLNDAEVDLRLRLAEDPTYIREVQDGFTVDAWLGNWDVVGANPAPGKGWDNIVSVAGHPVRIEAGGALRFRGLGGEKPFGPQVGEFDTLRDTSTGRRTGAVFGDMTPEQIIKSAERVRKVTPAKIKALIKKHGLDPELADTLIARREDILRRTEALAGPKPLTPREFAAAIKAAAKRQDALDAVEAGVTGHTPDIPGQPVHTIWRGIDDQEIKDAIDGYIANDFDITNGTLRQSPLMRDYQTKLARELIPDIDRALDGSRLTSDVELWRSPGSGRGIFGDPGTWGDDLAGFEWSDPAYSSASAIKRIADRFTKDGGVRLRILASKGSKALQLSPEKSSLAQYEESAAEAEVLLARGARYRVVRDRGWTEITHPTTHRRIKVRDLDVEVTVPDGTPPLPWETGATT